MTDGVSKLLLPTAQMASKYLLMPSMDAAGKDDVHDKWMLVTLFLDRIFFVVYLITVIVLIATLDTAEKLSV
jgi:uncharacterized membrane protein YozB (DUF420 family)